MKFIKSLPGFISRAIFIRSVPITSWSSQKPNIIFPKFETFAFLCLGVAFHVFRDFGDLAVRPHGRTPIASEQKIAL